jgi:pimeloyl-ACP methyl ester carboxylesterase
MDSIRGRDSMSVEVVRVEVADGVRLSVRRHDGRGDGRRRAELPFLLVHGLSSNALLWEAVARMLAGVGHAVYAVDLRSHGESSSTESGHDTGTAAEDVGAVIASLGLGPAVAVGQSWGGNVVVRLAARHPHRVAALALVDGGWLDLSADFDRWERCEAALRPPDVDGLAPNDIRGFLRSEHEGWSEEAIEATLANLRIRSDGRVERRLPIPAHLRIVRSMWDEPPWADLARITVPVLLIPAIPEDPDAAAKRRDQVARAAKLLASARIREYVGGDHDLHAQRPESLAADLLTLAEAH